MKSGQNTRQSQPITHATDDISGDLRSSMLAPPVRTTVDIPTAKIGVVR